MASLQICHSILDFSVKNGKFPSLTPLSNTEMQGFSVRNLQRMKQCAHLYPDLAITPQAVAQLPWEHISLLIQSIKSDSIRKWYAEQTIKSIEVVSGLQICQFKSPCSTATFGDAISFNTGISLLKMTNLQA